MSAGNFIWEGWDATADKNGHLLLILKQRYHPNPPLIFSPHPRGHISNERSTAVANSGPALR